MLAVHIPVAALAPIFVVLAGFLIFCFVDLVRAQSVKFLPKWAWALLCLASVPLGGIVYLLVGRDDRS